MQKEVELWRQRNTECVERTVRLQFNFFPVRSGVYCLALCAERCMRCVLCTRSTHKRVEGSPGVIARRCVTGTARGKAYAKPKPKPNYACTLCVAVRARRRGCRFHLLVRPNAESHFYFVLLIFPGAKHQEARHIRQLFEIGPEISEELLVSRAPLTRMTTQPTKHLENSC